MKKTSLPFLFLLVTLFSSCSYYDHKTKQEFYDQLSGANDSLDKMTGEWHQILDRAVVSKNFSALLPYRTKMAQFMSRNRTKIANIEVPPNADSIRDGEEVFLSARAAVISDAYPGFEPFNDITPNGDIEAQLKQVANDLETETAANAVIRKNLLVFAQKNALKTTQGITAK